MFGEKAVRRSAAPISSATERVALLKTARSIGSKELISFCVWGGHPRPPCPHDSDSQIRAAAKMSKAAGEASAQHPYTSITTFEYSSTSARQPGGTTVVALYS